MAKLKNRLPVAFLAVAAVLAAALGGVYGIWGSSGNLDGADQPHCARSQALAARLDGLNTGQVAAFQITDKPAYVGDISFNDDAGKTSSLADYRGRTVLLNLWATWCVPCREEMPTLDRLQAELGGKDFQVLPVSVDLGDDSKPRQFYSDTEIQSLPFRHDGTMGAFNELKKRSLAIGMPTTLIVDGEGCALGVMNGPADWASDDAKTMISAVIDPNS